jgi:dihydrofolate reductase
MNPTISLIAALSENRVIGNEGQIPWHIKADLIRFRDLTLGHVVIMGRKAFESMNEYYKKAGKPLPDRIHIVATRDKNYHIDSGFRRNDKDFVVYSIEEAIDLAKKLEKREIFISGGGQIYEQGIKYADKLYLTVIHKNFEGDVFFPDYSEFKKVISSEEKQEGEYHFTFLELTRERHSDPALAGEESRIPKLIY